jgi:hypothetical protein
MRDVEFESMQSCSMGEYLFDRFHISLFYRDLRYIINGEEIRGAEFRICGVQIPKNAS